MSNFALLICIVTRNYGDIIAKASSNAGATGGTILMGRGTASNKILQILGIGDSGKDIFLCIIEQQKKITIQKAIKTVCSKYKMSNGIMFTTNVSAKLQSNIYKKGEQNMQETNTTLITLIVNRGFADDAMEQARNAGASGGTILTARGTAKSGDAKFFGIDIVSEKEMLLIIVEKNKYNAVFEAIKNLKCLSTPGTGIIYSSPAYDFTTLGK